MRVCQRTKADATRRREQGAHCGGHAAHRVGSSPATKWCSLLRTGRAGKLEKTQPEAYRAFLAKVVGKRAEIENSRVFTANLKERLLTNFDHEEEHLKRLQFFFNEPSFDEWVQQNESLAAPSNTDPP